MVVQACGTPKSFFEKYPQAIKIIFLLIISIILFLIEFIFKITENKFLESFLKDEKLFFDLFLNLTLKNNE